MSTHDKSALYNDGVSNPILNSLDLIHGKVPGHNPGKSTNEKLTPMGHSPEKVEASRVEVQEKNAEVTLRAY
jgi:hypothetical protein